MKKIYFIASAISLFILSGCTKDYEDRIIGNWQIDDIDKFGIGGSIGNLPFKEGGSFNFMNDGTMTYTNPAGGVFKGTWNIETKIIDSGDNDKTYRSLHITAVNFTTQEVIGEYYDDFVFAGRNHIKAWIYSSSRTYVTHLRR